jgi:hypothetical protein
LEGLIRGAAPPELVAEASFHKDDFNEFSIRCMGKHVTTMVNGYTMVDQEFSEMPGEGIIAWEFHGNLPPKEVVFKGVEIREAK